MNLYRFIGLILVVCLTVGFSDLASIHDSRKLSQFLKTMSEIADDGPAMSYFGWREIADAGSEFECRPVTRETAESYLIELVKQMDWASSSQIKVLEEIKNRALSDFRSILKSDHLQSCEYSFHENMTFTRIVQFRNVVSGYIVEFTEGYED